MSIAAANKNKQVTTKDVPLDARLKHIKSVLYELPAKAAAEREAIAEQKDIDIPNGNLNIPTFLPAVYVGNDAVQIQKETIERAWCLLKQQESVMTMNALKRKLETV
ncbi:hypothetical protein BDEG_22276 [Batrachochytrium dendrobatidis JEL423]|uniref:Uncharacterized protein n=1 Tax=Batrachochytrium dendrobatidis (strain JEL423) TaxID=403673 RepID=A0A177WG40_BATDL|nr:hypothetical protein BDEG_22276 [Batrachochytrium dendrobatidis JEL423]